MKEHPSDDIDMLVGSEDILSNGKVEFMGSWPFDWSSHAPCDVCIATSRARGSAMNSARDG